MEKDKDSFTARPYQIDLYERAVSENTIIYLPTGTGKTYIAVMVIKKLSADIQKSYSEGGKHTVFLVNTVTLVTQQSKYIARLTGFSCGAYSGEQKVDLWREHEWQKELNENQVLVMTSQIFLDCLCHGYVDLRRVNLIIFDECHRAVNDHPMRSIMQRFENCEITDQPRVLAMSATLLNANVKLNSVETTIRNLETTFHARIATVDSQVDIEGYYATPKEIMVEYDAYVPSDVEKPVRVIINEVYNILNHVVLPKSTIIESSDVFKPKAKVSKLKKIFQNIEEQLSNTGVYGTSKAILLHLIQLEKIKKYTEDIHTSYILEYLVTQLIKLRKLLEDEMEDFTEIEKIYKHSSNQIQQLFYVLKEYYKKLNQQSFCCIIFVKRRLTAKVVYHILKNLHEHDEEFKFLLPDFVVGFSHDCNKSDREILCNTKWTKAALHRFRNGLSNCLAATDVIDEGIDIPTCTLIIRYDLPMDIRSYIQSKGRARHMHSQYVFLISKQEKNYLSRYQNFKSTEKYLQQTLTGKYNSRMKPTKESIETNLYKSVIKPYTVTAANGTICALTEQIVVNLINKYCQTLQQSKFSWLSPTWVLHESKGNEMSDEDKLYTVSLKLPIVSPLKSVIVGDPMTSINSAKRSVAMKTCIKLYKLGEITDQLLPKRINSITEDVDYLFPSWIDEDDTSGQPGTSKKKRQHQLQFPTALYGAYPIENNDLYLHILHAKPTYLVPHDNRNLVFYEMLNNASGFAILSTKKIPKVPPFPIFMNVGELIVNVKVNHATLKLSAEEIKSMRMFHSMIFRQIVPVIKDFMVFDNDNLDNSFLIVPVGENWEINWDLIKRYQHINRIPASTPLNFRNGDYELALVEPSYRGTPKIYVVTQICDDLTPQSCFPTDDFYSYVHYYHEKHGLVIQDLKQPMLEVKPISKKIGCIKPRSVKPGLSKRKRADLLEDFEEHLIPELCYKIDFPALYWLKITMLPSVIHRISQLLVAEDLRTTIVKEANLGLLDTPQGKEWPPLILTDEEREEIPEPSLDTTYDEAIEKSQPEPSLSGPEIDVLNTEMNHYPWTKEQEPSDIDRNVEQIQLIDIEYYCQFVYGMVDPGLNVMKPKKVKFFSKPSVVVPVLQVLSKDDPYGPDPVQITYALTTKLGNDAFDLERLETLGDSYLKYIISLFLYKHFSNYNEGQLTALKGKLIGNRNLYYCGAKKHIPGRMKVDDFIPMSNFVVPAYTTFRPLQKILLNAEVSPNVLYELHIPEEEQYTGCISETTINRIEEKVLHWDAEESQTGIEHYLGVQTVSDKAVADCVEALIGVYLKSMGVKGAAHLLQWLNILPKEISVMELLYSAPKNPTIADGDPSFHMPWISKIETTIGYKFRNQGFLLQAFTHASYSANSITECYQRLEFLGDAILDFLITCYIYENCGDLSPGALTDLRSALVNNITLACLSVRYGLHTALLAYAPKLNEIIDKFVKFQEERNHVVNDELLWILLEEEESNMAEYIDVPKVLGDLFETTIGAIYLDCNKCLKTVWEIVYPLMHKEIDEFSRNVPKQPIRVLTETQGARPRFSKAIKIEGTGTTMVPLQVTIGGNVKLFHGFGANKKQAKCAAAKLALRSLLCKI